MRGANALLVTALLALSAWGAQVRPGVVITRENLEQYVDSLRELTDPGTFRSLTNDLRRGLCTVPVIRARRYPRPKPYWNATLRYHERCRLGPRGELIGWVAGAPFPNPTSGLELAWDFDKRHMTGDQYSFYGVFRLFDRNAKLERTFRWHYWKMFYCGRYEMPPLPEVPGNRYVVHLKEAFTIVRPFDVKGFSVIRTRYIDVHRPDEVYSYLPALRRMRRLTGADVCDPVLGSDVIYDDFDYCRQKVDPSVCEYRMLPGRKLLVAEHKREPIGPVDPVKMTCRGRAFQLNWEIRPVWVLEIRVKDPTYAYGRRVLYMERQRGTFVGLAVDSYDQRGRLFRSQIGINSYVGPPTFSNKGWHGGRYFNHLTGHCTQLMHEATHLDPVINARIFTFRWLLRQAR